MSFGPGFGGVPVVWYFTPPGTPFLADVCSFRSLNWEEQNSQPNGTWGEDWDAPRPWRNGAVPVLPCDDLVPFGTPAQFEYGVNTDGGGPPLPNPPTLDRSWDCSYANAYGV